MDKSYTPINSTWTEFRNKFLDDAGFSEEQMKLFQSIYFAGASSSFGFVRENPRSQGIILDELVDYCDQLSDT